MGIKRLHFDTVHKGSVVRKITVQPESDGHCVIVQTDYSVGDKMVGECVILLVEELKQLMPVFRDVVKSGGSSGCKCVKVEVPDSTADIDLAGKQTTIMDYFRMEAENDKA